MMFFRRSKKLKPIKEPSTDSVIPFDEARLDADGVWYTIDLFLVKNGQRFKWDNDIPDELRQDAANALRTVVKKLEEKDK